jgi:hypothetical protein
MDAPVRWPTACAPPTNPLAALDAAACPSPWIQLMNDPCGYSNKIQKTNLDLHHGLLRWRRQPSASW